MGHRLETDPGGPEDRGIQIANIILNKVLNGTLEPREVRTLIRILNAAGYTAGDSSETTGISPLLTRRQIAIGSFTLEPVNKILRLPNNRLITEIPLKELCVLTDLMGNSPNTRTRRQLMDAADINIEADERVIDVYVNSLRRRIDDEKPPRHILTVRGIGYAFRG